MQDSLTSGFRRAGRFLFRPGRRDKLRHKLRLSLARQRPAVRANRAKLERELANRAARLESHPTTLIIDPFSACNLSCPFCPTGGGYGPVRKEVLTPERFARVVGHLRTELLEKVFLYREGEPLLNRSILDYTRFFSRRGAYTEISTNLSMEDFDRRFFEQLVDSGLSELKVSIDGARQETHEKYRVNGDLTRVVGNMKRLAAVKEDRRRSYPHVTYRMLLNTHNQHEVEEAALLAEECGADFSLDPGFWCPEEERDEWMAEPTPNDRGMRTALVTTDNPPGESAASPKRGAPIDTYCRQLWDTVVINANGEVYPCCLMFKPEHAVGNLIDQDIEEIRNSPELVYLRRYVSDPSAAAPDFDSYCESCSERHCVATAPSFSHLPWR